MASDNQNPCGCGGSSSTPSASSPRVTPQQTPGEDIVACEQTVSDQVCVEANVTITPFVTPGTPTVTCLGPISFGPCTDFTQSPTRSCRFTVSQVLCVNVPLSFGADVQAEIGNVACGIPTPGPDCPPPLPPCTCGALIAPNSAQNNVQVNGDPRQGGTLSSDGSICSDTLSTSVYNFAYADATDTDLNFTFNVAPATITGTTFTSVVCRREGNGACVITVTGTGLVTLADNTTSLETFELVLRDSLPTSAQFDRYTLIIGGTNPSNAFFSTTGEVQLPNGTITGLGCN